jgi:hypothetical protein
MPLLFADCISESRRLNKKNKNLFLCNISHVQKVYATREGFFGMSMDQYISNLSSKTKNKGW